MASVFSILAFSPYFIDSFFFSFASSSLPPQTWTPDCTDSLASLPQKPLPGWQHPASGTWSCLYSSDIQIYAPNPDVPLTSRLTNHLSTWLFYNLKLCVCDWTCSSLVAPTSKTLVTPSHQLLRLKLLGTFVGTFTYILFYWYLHFQNICRVHPYLSTSAAMVEALRISWFLSYRNQWYKQPSRQHGL